MRCEREDSDCAREGGAWRARINMRSRTFNNSQPRDLFFKTESSKKYCNLSISELKPLRSPSQVFRRAHSRSDIPANLCSQNATTRPRIPQSLQTPWRGEADRDANAGAKCHRDNWE